MSKAARHLPVHTNLQGREVFSRAPDKHKGFETSSPWLEWVKWSEAVVAIAVGNSAPQGFRVEGWQEVLRCWENDEEEVDASGEGGGDGDGHGSEVEGAGIEEEDTDSEDVCGDDFVCDSESEEESVEEEEPENGEVGGDDDEHGSESEEEIPEEEKDEGETRIVVGSMVKVRSPCLGEWEESSEQRPEWYLAEAREFSDEDGGGWVHLHLWRTHSQHEDEKALHLPVFTNASGREVCSSRPGGVKGFEVSSPWMEWVKMEEAVLAIAVGVASQGGYRVERWMATGCGAEEKR